MSDNFDPYCHITECHRCGEYKPCVEGFESDGGDEPAFYECEDCSKGIRHKFRLADLERAVIETSVELRRTQTPMKRIADHELAWNKFKDAVDALLREREGGQ